MSQKNEEVLEWMEKADRDLLSAAVLIDHDPPITDTGCFHCQQAAEKALKAYLVYRGRKFEKVHSMTYLVDLCVQEESSYEIIRELSELLAPYAVEVRYPGAMMNIAIQEAEEAYKAARSIYEFVKQTLT